MEPAILGWVTMRCSTMCWITHLESRCKLQCIAELRYFRRLRGTLGCREVSRRLKSGRGPGHARERTFCWFMMAPVTFRFQLSRFVCWRGVHWPRGGGGCGSGRLFGSLPFGGWFRTFRPRSRWLPVGLLDGDEEGTVIHSAGLCYVLFCCGFGTEDCVARFRAISLTSKEVVGDGTHLICDICEQRCQFGGAHGVGCPGFR